MSHLKANMLVLQGAKMAELPNHWKTNQMDFMVPKVNRLVERLKLSEEVHERARRSTERLMDKGLIRGWSEEEFVSAVVYISSRKEGDPRPLSEICNVFNLKKRSVGRCFRKLTREAGINLKPVDAKKYIKRYGKEAILPEKVVKKAIDIYEEAKDKKVTYGKGKKGIASACLYIAGVLCDEKRTQKDIHQVTGTTEVTIRKRYKDIAEKLGIDVIDTIDKGKRG